MTTTAQRCRLFGFVSLFTSFGTLICCALPSLLVLLGLGATVASLLSAAPWLVALSRQKNWVFAVAGALIAGNFFYVHRIAPRLRGAREACRPDSPEACAAADRTSQVVLWLSTAIYLIGFLTAFVIGPLLARLDGSIPDLFTVMRSAHRARPCNRQRSV